MVGPANQNSEIDIVGSVVALIAPFNARPSFAIPIIEFSTRSNAQYVQRVNHSGRIRSFALLDGSVAGARHELTVPFEVSIGDEEVFACIDPWGKKLLGRRESLAPHIFEWVSSIGSPSERLNFAALCDSPRVFQESALLAVEAKAAELRSKVQASLWFARTVGLRELVRSLASSNEALEQEDDIYHNLAASVKIENDRLVFGLPPSLLGRNNSASLYRKNLADSLRLIEYATSYGIDVKEQPKRFETLVTIEEHVNDVMRQIARLPRLEERLVAIIGLILNEPPVGKLALRRYEDRARYARDAIVHLRENLLNPDSRIESSSELIVLSMRRWFYKLYSAQRNRVRQELKKKLGANHPVTQQLMVRFRR